MKKQPAATAVRLVAAHAADWPAISALLVAAQLPLDGALDHLPGFIVAFRNSDLIGSAALETYGPVGLLRSVAVTEAQRGSSVGSQLVHAIISRAKNTGLESVVLLTETAHAYFPRFGFQEIDRSAIPEPVTMSIEFQSACPVSAAVMQLDL